MASGDPRDPQTGLPYTGSPVQQASRDGVLATVLNMNRLKTETITMHSNDNHYDANGDLYHE